MTTEEALARDPVRTASYHAAEAAKLANFRAEPPVPPAPPKPRRKLSKPRVGPRMRAIQAFASAYPGESATTVVAATTGPYKRWTGAPSHRKALYRAEAAGLVIIDRVQPNLYRVFVSEADRKAWYQRQEQEAKAITPGMRELADIVSAMPGISKSGALQAADMGSDRELARAIDAGLIIVEHVRSNLFRLFATERDKKIWHLRRELLQPGTLAERVAEIRAEIDRLQAERAQTWAQALRVAPVAG